jgi:hypothetical protein
MLEVKKEQISYLTALNHIDDLLTDMDAGRPYQENLAAAVQRYRGRFEPGSLTQGQKKRLGGFLSELYRRLKDKEDGDSEKLAAEIKGWLRDLGDGGYRITIRKPAEKVSLADRFRLLMQREMDEMAMQFSRHDHLLTCLDDILKSAETKVDPMYRHLAATIIYYLRMEGYKVDPYVERLKRIRAET